MCVCVLHRQSDDLTTLKGVGVSFRLHKDLREEMMNDEEKMVNMAILERKYSYVSIISKGISQSEQQVV